MKISYLAGAGTLSVQGEHRLVATLYAQTASMWIGARSMLLVGVLAWARTGLPWLLGWVAISAFIFAARFALAGAYQRWGSAADSQLWARRFAVGAWATGCLWGVISILVIMTNDPFTLFMAISVQAGYLAGLSVRNNASPAAAYGQVYLTLVPLTVICLASGNIYYQIYSLFAASHIFANRALIGYLSSSTVRLIMDDEQNTALLVELTQANLKLSRLARTDDLTGLANRPAFLERLATSFASAERNPALFAVLYLDLDHFKEINDTFGHSAGDALLRMVADRLISVVRDTDLVARIGGDEFAVLQTDMTELASSSLLATRIRAAIAAPYMVEGSELRVTASIGIAPYGLGTAGPDEILKKADLALYRAKAQGRDRFRFHSDDLDALVREHVNLVEELRGAIERHELDLYYQPQVAIASGEIVGMEALVRWKHPVRGVLPASEFIPVAEKSGLIIPLGYWVLDKACAQMRSWTEDGIVPPVVAVNLSAAQLKSGNELLRAVVEASRKWGIAPSRLEFDITETVLAGIMRDGSNVIEQLKQLGVGIALDDFGMDASSIGRLAANEVRRIKIAPQFIDAMVRTEADVGIVRAMIGLARQLGIEVIAEGVETDRQRAVLLDMAGATKAQGYLYSPAVTAEDAAGLLRQHSLLPSGGEGAEPSPAPLIDTLPSPASVP